MDKLFSEKIYIRYTKKEFNFLFMIGESGYRPKSPEELRQQFETAQSDLGTKTEHMFTPPLLM